MYMRVHVLFPNSLEPNPQTHDHFVIPHNNKLWGTHVLFPSPIPLSPIHGPENKFGLLKNPLLYLFHKKCQGSLTKEKKLGPPAHL